MGEDNIAKQGKDFHPQKTRPKTSMIIKGGPSRERGEEAWTCDLRISIQIK